MPSTLDPVNVSTSVGEDFAVFATATALDLRTVSGKPQRCPRRIIALAAGTWSVLKNTKEVDAAPGAVPEGFIHDASTSIITSNAKIMVVW